MLIYEINDDVLLCDDVMLINDSIQGIGNLHDKSLFSTTFAARRVNFALWSRGWRRRGGGHLRHRQLKNDQVFHKATISDQRLIKLTKTINRYTGITESAFELNLWIIY